VEAEVVLKDTDLDLAFQKIIDVTEGSPLYMEDLLRLCRSLKVSEAIDRWRQNKGDAARHD
jgi:EAL domain-containing protein (putative c-di-GMP-specific phosphodiesterase class I)